MTQRSNGDSSTSDTMHLGELNAIVRLVFEPGHALFFDECFMHRTAVAEGTNRDRYAIEPGFFAPSQYPVDQLSVARSPAT